MYSMKPQKKTPLSFTVPAIKERLHFVGKGRASAHNHQKGRKQQQNNRILNGE